ncbi:hypothetical protein V6Z11_A03G141800 [Gossypium hirsutum]
MDGVELSSKSLASCSQSAMMDLGVGSFVLMNAVTSRQARNIKSSMSWWKAAFKSATPLLLLGFARLASTLSLDYQVLVGEYGVNWNMEFNILALFSHQNELCFRNSNTLCVCVCILVRQLSDSGLSKSKSSTLSKPFWYSFS